MSEQEMGPTRPLPAGPDSVPFRLVIPWAVAGAWTIVAVLLLIFRPAADGTNFIDRGPGFGSSWLPPTIFAGLLLLGALGLGSRRRTGWLVALTVTALLAVVHPYHALISACFVPYLLTRSVRLAYGVTRLGEERSAEQGAFGWLTSVAFTSVLVFHLILAPNMFGALQRGKSKRTLGDMRTIATAVESYLIDHQRYPRHAGDVEGLSEHLVPTYIKMLPRFDGWRQPFWYESRVEDVPSYTIVTFGKDGVPSGPREGPTSSYEADVIFANGRFVTYPEGTMK